MEKKSFLVGVVVIAFCIGGTARAEAPAASGGSTGAKPSVTRSAVVKTTATVQAIDLKNRLVTLKGVDGNTFEILVGKQAKNLPQVKVGDIVEAAYYESVAIKVYKAGAAPAGVEAAGVLATAKPGDMPGGIAAKQVTVTATVQSIDRKNQTAVLKGPEGNSVTIKVRDPRNLVNVNVGDEVVATYTRAFAISVEKPAQK